MEVVKEAEGKVREVKAQLELNVTRDIRANRKGLARSIERKRRTGDNVGPV